MFRIWVLLLVSIFPTKWLPSPDKVSLPMSQLCECPFCLMLSLPPRVGLTTWRLIPSLTQLSFQTPLLGTGWRSSLLHLIRMAQPTPQGIPGRALRYHSHSESHTGLFGWSIKIKELPKCRAKYSFLYLAHWICRNSLLC